MQTQERYFVIAATVAAELHKAMVVAEKISLASSNAGVLAARAGSSAAGFGALSQFVDELARKTVHASIKINQQAIAMSRLASNAVRTKTAYDKFSQALIIGKEAKYIDSLRPVHERIAGEANIEQADFDKHVAKLKTQLNELKRELDIAQILASMSQVEAAQANPEHQAALKDNAINIGQAAAQIEKHVIYSLSLFSKFN
jgi:hypothetical protein